MRSDDEKNNFDSYDDFTRTAPWVEILNPRYEWKGENPEYVRMINHI